MSKTARYIYLAESDLQIGSSLPWSVYLRSGDLLAPAGFVVQDQVVLKRMMMAVPMRLATPVDGDTPSFEATADHIAEKMAPNTADPLRYLKHNAEGVVLVFKLPSDFEPRKVQVDFYGRIPLQSIIVSAPVLGLGSGQTWQNFEGLPVTAQVIFGKSLSIFKTSVMRYAPLPSGHLFLRYPTEAATQPFRQALRVDAKIPATISMPDGYTVPALITNLSGSGCAIATGFVLGETSAQLKVAFRVKIGERAQVLTLPCIIRSIKGKLSQQMRYGIEFDQGALDPESAQALRAYVYEHIAEQ